MELRHLRYFVTVAEELHFGRAAERLNMSQPPLSRQILELEEELGFALFVREYHKVALTEAGKTYLAHARQILDQVARARQEAHGIAIGRTGTLRVGHGTHLPDGYLSRVLAAFREVAPEAAIELFEAPTPRVLRALRDKSIDVGMVLTPADRSGLALKPLLREELVIALPADHPYVHAPLHHLSQLANENFVTCRRYEDPGYREIVEAICEREGFVPRVLQAVEHKYTVLELVAKGFGITFIQRSAMFEGCRGVKYRAFPKSAESAESTPHIESAIAWREDASHSLLDLFVETTERTAAQLPARAPQAADQDWNGAVEERVAAD